MNMSRVGKFESLKLVNEFDKCLIELYGTNMTDAHITRFEVLASIGETGSACKSAELFGKKLGLVRLAEAA